MKTLKTIFLLIFVVGIVHGQHPDSIYDSLARSSNGEYDDSYFKIPDKFFVTCVLNRDDDTLFTIYDLNIFLKDKYPDYDTIDTRYRNLSTGNNLALHHINDTIFLTFDTKKKLPIVNTDLAEYVENTFLLKIHNRNVIGYFVIPLIQFGDHYLNNTMPYTGNRVVANGIYKTEDGNFICMLYSKWSMFYTTNHHDGYPYFKCYTKYVPRVIKFTPQLDIIYDNANLLTEDDVFTDEYKFEDIAHSIPGSNLNIKIKNKNQLTLYTDSNVFSDDDYYAPQTKVVIDMDNGDVLEIGTGYYHIDLKTPVFHTIRKSKPIQSKPQKTFDLLGRRMKNITVNKSGVDMNHHNYYLLK